MPRPDVPPGFDHTPPNPQSCVPASVCDDNLSPINSSFPLPRGSSFPPLHPVCRIISPPPPAYQHSRSHYLISYSRTVHAISDEPLRRVRECIRKIPPNGHCSTFDNPPAVPLHVYRCGPAEDRKSSLDIPSRLRVHRCRP